MDILNRSNPLHKALLFDDHSALQRLLKGVNLVEYRENDGSTLLHLAARAFNACFIKYLIEAGCDVNARNNQQDVPLHSIMTFSEGNIEERVPVVKLLVQAGANMDLKNSFGDDALNLCISGDSHCDWDSIFDDLVTAKVLLDAGADVNIQDKYYETPLHKAASTLSSKTVDLLLNYAVDIHLKNQFNDTVLHKVARSGMMYGINNYDDKHSRQLYILQSLLNKGADVNIENDKRQTPFHFLLESGNKEAIDLFIEYGADLSKKDYKGRGPMFYAAANEDTNAVKLLLEKGYNIEERDSLDRTPLHHNVKYKDFQNINFLCNNGANINSVDEFGMTPLYALFEYNKENRLVWSSPRIELLVDLLIDLGADVNALTLTDQMLLDIVEDSATEESKYFVIKLFAKLEFFGIEVDNSQMEDIENDEDKFREYYEKCLTELSTIENFTFYGTTPILPIFEDDQTVIASYVKDQSLKSAFDAINFNELFPIYGKAIKERFDIERAKYELRVDAFDILSNSLPSEISTSVIVREIMNHLDDKALVRFMRPFNKYCINATTKTVYLTSYFKVSKRNNTQNQLLVLPAPI